MIVVVNDLGEGGSIQCMLNFPDRAVFELVMTLMSFLYALETLVMFCNSFERSVPIEFNTGVT